MIVKGLIVNIPSYKATINSGDLRNTCDVRIPSFEDVTGSGEVIIPDAQIVVQPGLFGNYQVNDVVWVAFEDEQYDTPVVIGKLFRGNAMETTELREAARKGALVQDSITSQSTATLPVNTIFSVDPKKATQVNNNPNSELFSAKQLYQMVLTLQQQVSTLQSEVQALRVLKGNIL